MNKKEIISPEINSQIDWNKSVAQIIAEQCETTPNSSYYLASSIYLRLIPSFGYVRISYDFNKLEIAPDFSHILLVEQLELKVIHGSLKFSTDNFRIESVELMGNRVKYATEEPDSYEIVQNLNEVLISSSSFSLLIVPEFSTGQVQFTFDKEEISRFLIGGWEENISGKATFLERIRNALPNTTYSA
ncbi:hypothetical protein DXT99_25395 [Pontibacter diazotrophicus]|uniref:Uncharacterized protein n=1 Tax=Pontibacter diazotrophicus TaxID=1400979 RepID=A0A3D8L1I2_9BACT|nr:hypothetical protein [Pontibacter diazotrophicus]RDV11057.1 hypothetical protein DXT99_25395 [Pontibacter diazotrophicus]